MSATDPGESSPQAPSVFLSYATEDRPAAQSVRDALEACGLEVWYDESGLDGGDAWDQKIRRQIRECDFFMPLISAQTEARPEGYFRREWRLAVERTLDMADDHPFLLPVVIDDTTQAGARVPEKFLSVQWVRVPGGQPTAALEALCRRLVSGQRAFEPSRKSRLGAQAPDRPQLRSAEYPEFPRQEPGQRIRFWAQVLGWALQSGWIVFRRFPAWVRICIYVWLAIVLMSRACVPSKEHARRSAAADTATRTEPLTAEEPRGAAATALGNQIAHQITAEVGKQLAAGTPALLAVPFSAPSDDPVAQKLADQTFARVYGTVEHSHHGRVGLTREPLSAPDRSAAVERGRAHHSRYVLYGAVEKAAQELTISMVAVADGSLLWSHSYAVAAADPSRIAAEVDSRVPALEE
jgi:TolB-like protein